MLKFSRLMWDKQCTIVSDEKDASSDGRKRRQMWVLCLYLQRHTDLLPTHKLHIIEKEESYFQRQPLDNVLMWKRHLDIILDPQNNPPKIKITQKFWPPAPPAGRPRQRKEKLLAHPRKKKV